MVQVPSVRVLRWLVGLGLACLACAVPALADTWAAGSGIYIKDIKSVTVADGTDRATLGIGEHVLCTVDITSWKDCDYNETQGDYEEDTIGICTWSKSGTQAASSELSTITGYSTQLTASRSPGGVTVTATVQDSGSRYPEEVVRAKGFTILAPSSVSYAKNYDSPYWVPWTAGVKRLAARTYFKGTLGPSDVSFAEVEIRENFGQGETGTWPDGSTWQGSVGTVQAFIGPYNEFNDRQEFFPLDSSVLYNGSDWVDYSLSISIPLEYKDADDEWVLFYTATAKQDFLHSNRTTRVGVGDAMGAYQGPWQQE